MESEENYELYLNQSTEAEISIGCKSHGTSPIFIC